MEAAEVMEAVAVPEQLLDAVRSRAEKERIPFQRFIRMALEQALQRGKS